MKNDKQRLVELIKGAGAEATKYINEIMREVIDKEFRFASKEDIDWEEVNKIEADYLLANGVIVLPCKVGDVVYWLDNGKIKSDEVFEISIHSDGILIHTGIQFCLEQVFLSREEAEQALNNVQNGNSCEGGAE